MSFGSRRALLLAAMATLLAADAEIAAGHEVRPGYLAIEEQETGRYDVVFKVPSRGDRRLSLGVRLPDGCTQAKNTASFRSGAYLERFEALCSEPLTGRTITIDGLSATRTDVLARVERMDGTTQTTRLTPDAPTLRVAAAPTWLEVAGTYFGLGIEHILLGIDHLLFVLALLFLVGSWKRLVGTITAFTLAHSVTLAAATLGWVHVPQAPVEAAIALSIVFVAVEILHGLAGRRGLAARRPWVVAFCFGLLHGLGFAGALSEVGIPQQAIPTALAFFNLGVEAGQLAFIAAVFAAFSLATRLGAPGTTTWGLAARAAKPAAYGIGTLAAFWLIERTLAFLSV